jgi:hypothetical protein
MYNGCNSCTATDQTLNYLVLVGPTRALQVSPRPAPPQWSFIFIFVQEIILILKNVKFFFARGSQFWEMAKT